MKRRRGVKRLTGRTGGVREQHRRKKRPRRKMTRWLAIRSQKMGTASDQKKQILREKPETKAGGRKKRSSWKRRRTRR